MIKTSWIYILFYIQLALILNLVIYASVAIIYEIVKATYIFKPFVRYTFVYRSLYYNFLDDSVGGSTYLVWKELLGRNASI